MSENTTTEQAPEQTPGERWRAEQKRLSTPEGAQEAQDRAEAKRNEQIARRLRESWGGDESGFQRGLVAVELTQTRLGLTPEQVADAERLMGVEGATDLARRTGEALALIDPDTTPAEARERMDELMSDPGFLARMKDGDRRAVKTWDALNTIAAFGAR